METDPEMLAAFAQEVQQIADDLAPIANELKIHYQTRPDLFEKFGQVIDRIYGTAATLGYKEIADYCRCMKTTAYKCSQSGNSYAQNQVKDLVTGALPLVRKMQAVIHDPTQLRKIQYSMQKERERAEELCRKLFGSIRRGSTAA